MYLRKNCNKMCVLKIIFLAMGIVCVCAADDYPLPSDRRHERPNQNFSRWNRRDLQNRSRSSTQTNSNLTPLITDRVSALATLDEAQRNKLDAVLNMLIKLNETTASRLDSISNQEMQTSKRLANLENMQRDIGFVVGSIRSELDSFRSNIHQMQDDSHVVVRNAGSSSNQTDDLNIKLDSLSTFLGLTQLQVKHLEDTLRMHNATVTRLTELTRDANNRVTALSGRRRNYNHVLPPYAPHFFSYPAAAPQGPVFLDSDTPNSCAQASLAKSGIHKIQMDAQSEPFYVSCDSAEFGGWTVIQYRFDGSINFNRDWSEYKTGFGNLAGEFFIGLDKLHAMTSTTLHELEIELTDFNNQTRTARYSSFAIGNENEFYPLHVLGSYSGTAGDSLRYHAGNKFSTFDNDNDGWVEGNCAQAHTGAWWYAACETSNLNGQYFENGTYDAGQQYQGMYWNDYRGPLYSLKISKMKIRPIPVTDTL